MVSKRRGLHLQHSNEYTSGALQDVCAGLGLLGSPLPAAAGPATWQTHGPASHITTNTVRHWRYSIQHVEKVPSGPHFRLRTSPCLLPGASSTCCSFLTPLGSGVARACQVAVKRGYTLVGHACPCCSGGMSPEGCRAANMVFGVVCMFGLLFIRNTYVSTVQGLCRGRTLAVTGCFPIPSDGGLVASRPRRWSLAPQGGPPGLHLFSTCEGVWGGQGRKGCPLGQPPWQHASPVLAVVFMLPCLVQFLAPWSVLRAVMCVYCAPAERRCTQTEEGTADSTVQCLKEHSVCVVNYQFV
jgi:hypothetical protein